MTDPDVVRDEERSRQEAEAIAHRWPNEEQRKARRAKLHENLDIFLDAFVETQGSGWAAAETADTDALHAIMQEVVDLKFERDCDGDSVINYHIVNRRHGRLISTYVPYQPRTKRSDTEEPITARDILEYIRESVRAARYLISSGEDVMRTLDYDFKDVESALPPVIRLADAEGALVTSFGPDMDWKTGLAAIEKFIDTYSDARDAIARVKDAYMAVYGETSFFAAANAEIMDMLSTGRLDDARSLVYEHRKLYGVGIRDGINAFNEAHRTNERRKADEARVRPAVEKAAEVS